MLRKLLFCAAPVIAVVGAALAMNQSSSSALALNDVGVVAEVSGQADYQGHGYHGGFRGEYRGYHGGYYGGHRGHGHYRGYGHGYYRGYGYGGYRPYRAS